MQTTVDQLARIAASDHDCPAAHQPFTGYTIPELSVQCPVCYADPNAGCVDDKKQPLPHFHSGRLALAMEIDATTHPAEAQPLTYDAIVETGLVD